MSTLDAKAPAVFAALKQLRSRLIDLSARNRLINFKHTIGKSLQFVEANPAAIYKRLLESDGKAKICIRGIPDASKENWIEINGVFRRPEPREWAKACGFAVSFDLPSEIKDENASELRTVLYPDDLAKFCRKIEREATLTIEETGANMLYLVLGFLEFPEHNGGGKIFTAPLICIPVSLQRVETVGVQQFQLEYTGEDITSNPSLSEKLQNHFGMVLPELSEEENINDYFLKIKTLIENQPGFALRHRVSLCFLSFRNMLLVRDLDPENWGARDGQNLLMEHPIIREIFEGRDANGSELLPRSEEHPVEEPPGADIPLVFNADSSQHNALIDVLAHKKNLVIEGPPGTGKSQTITNLIAACLAEGKKVLFVADKMAALEVVKNRLARAGLDPFVLELHSNKTNKKQLLQEIAKRIEFEAPKKSDVPTLQLQLEGHRRELKSYTDLINSHAYNSLGLTLHEIIWRFEKHRQRLGSDEDCLSRIHLADAFELTDIEFSRRLDSIRFLAQQCCSMGEFALFRIFVGFNVESLTPGDEVELSRLLADCQEWGAGLSDSCKNLSLILGSPIKDLTLSNAAHQLRLLREIVNDTDQQRFFELVPRLIMHGHMNSNIASEIVLFSEQINRFNALEKVVEDTFRSEANVTPDKMATMRSLLQKAEGLGLKLGTPSEIQNLHRQIVEAMRTLAKAYAVIQGFMETRGVVLSGTRYELEQLLKLLELIIAAPEELLHLQQSSLNSCEAVVELERLVALRNEKARLEMEVEQVLYSDILPTEPELEQAIFTLRQGARWYRGFQKKWRRAVQLHRSLQRIKEPLSIEERKAQLEQLLRLTKVREEWKKTTLWEHLKISELSASSWLDSYLSLARWNQSIKNALDNLNLPSRDLFELIVGQARAQRKEFGNLKGDIISALHAINALNERLFQNTLGNELSSISDVVDNSKTFAEALEGELDWLVKEVRPHVPLSQVIIGCDTVSERSDLGKSISGNEAIKELLGEYFCGERTDCSSLISALEFVQKVTALDFLPEVRARLLTEKPRQESERLVSVLEEIYEGLQRIAEFRDGLSHFEAFHLEEWIGATLSADLEQFVQSFLEKVGVLRQNLQLLRPWSLYLSLRRDANKHNLRPFIELLEEGAIRADRLADAYAYCVYNTIIREAFRNVPQLNRFSGLKHQQVRDEFVRLDTEIISQRGKMIARECSQRMILPQGRNGARVHDRTEMVLLNYLMPQKRPRMPVRKILNRAGRAIQALKPCFMMGPQAVAQYLTPGALSFDLVIMDEASQLKPEEAIGAIARGRQLVVVGDPKQLPPTTFFSRFGEDGNLGEEQYTTTDAESILDVCSVHFKPIRTLRWHYRSRHHSLIEFSNHSFYDGNLVIFPSPSKQGGRLGVRAIYLADAIYEQQRNLREAKRVVDAVVEHIATRSEESLGVVTLNIRQRDLIAELLEERLKSEVGSDNFKTEWQNKGAPLFVKNLENVQGDERDAIIISTTFGKAPGSTSVRQNFGPISRQGGWRRLNVLFTRAKTSVLVVTSLRPADIVLDRLTPEGTRAFRNYLEYAQSGCLPTSEETDREPDSDFEISVMTVLKQYGYEVTPQLGVAGYRIDIAVRHPDAQGYYLAAIECDGATYHSALSVRDRDRIRQEVLESLGWRDRIWRIWSTDWFRNPRQETDKMLKFLAEVRRSFQPAFTQFQTWTEEDPAAQDTKQEGIYSGDHFSCSEESASEKLEVGSLPIDTNDNLEVQVGDIVRYVELEKPNLTHSLKIPDIKDEFQNGSASRAKHLAQLFIGGVAGDEILAHSESGEHIKLRIVDIER